MPPFDTRANRQVNSSIPRLEAAAVDLKRQRETTHMLIERLVERLGPPQAENASLRFHNPSKLPSTLCAPVPSLAHSTPFIPSPPIPVKCLAPFASYTRPTDPSALSASQEAPPSLFTPPFFDGTRHEGRTFYTACRTHIRSHPEEFHHDSDKICFVMSHMQSGRAGRWATRELGIERNGTPRFANWQEFAAQFRKDFAPLKTQDDAIGVLATNRYHQGSRTVAEYLEGFRDLVDDSGCTDAKQMVLKFRRGLDRRLSNTMATLGRPSDRDPEAWFQLAIQVDQDRDTSAPLDAPIRQVVASAPTDAQLRARFTSRLSAGGEAAGVILGTVTPVDKGDLPSCVDTSPAPSVTTAPSRSPTPLGATVSPAVALAPIACPLSLTLPNTFSVGSPDGEAPGSRLSTSAGEGSPCALAIVEAAVPYVVTLASTDNVEEPASSQREPTSHNQEAADLRTPSAASIATVRPCLLAKVSVDARMLTQTTVPRALTPTLTGGTAAPPPIARSTPETDCHQPDCSAAQLMVEEAPRSRTRPTFDLPLPEAKQPHCNRPQDAPPVQSLPPPAIACVVSSAVALPAMQKIAPPLLAESDPPSLDATSRSLVELSPTIEMLKFNVWRLRESAGLLPIDRRMSRHPKWARHLRPRKPGTALSNHCPSKREQPRGVTLAHPRWCCSASRSL